ncbi:MAG: ADP-heptose--LPS heptosyltransferase [Bacteroidota bacterium]|nr:ADP-heptose--LPS heptosyltransferase [Flavisolibacter sp.]MDQ3843924.1 ADP-heptose--LPS heptosyltransferase [Bacteroidota bacterium]
MSQSIQEDTSDLWMYHMRRGAFEEAWKFSDAVLQSRAGKPCWHLPRHFQYIWDGTSLEGKRVLVRCYHGLGDTIQFIRYAPLLKATAREVIVWAQPPLIPLLQTVEGIDRLLPLHDGTPEVEYDADVEVMELPHIFRTTLATIPSTVPYIHVEPMPLPAGNRQLSVGLVWKAGDWDRRRNIPFPFLKPLAEVQHINLYILQAAATLAGWEEGFGIHPGEYCLYDYARVIRGLDLMISLDSMPVHLAGAQGVPVWNLLHAEADWRWMNHRADSPWYPTMRLFRQQHPGDWASVILCVKSELEKLSKR